MTCLQQEVKVKLHLERFQCSNHFPPREYISLSKNPDQCTLVIFTSPNFNFTSVLAVIHMLRFA
jgi:hypothetical protein